MTTFVLKIVAEITMLIDHVTASYYEQSGLVTLTRANYYFPYLFLRGVGRIAFPIFCFLIVEGLVHTKSKWRYALRLFIFALLSEIPFNLALFGKFFDLAHQNVDLTLLLGFSAVLGIMLANRLKGWWRALGYFGATVAAAGMAAIACLLKTDYGAGGVLQIFIMGFLTLPLDEIRPGLSKNRWLRGAIYALAIVSMCIFMKNEFEAIALASVPFVVLYNGKPGPKNRLTKWGSYLFYPVHLAVLALIFVVPRLAGWR